MTTLTSGAMAAALLVVSPLLSADAAPGACEALAALTMPHTTVRVAQTVSAGAFVPPTAAGAAAPSTRPFRALPAFCRVAATLTPTDDSDINIEVWMPIAGWNGKFEAVGNGGFAGRINYATFDTSLASELGRGYATASTDTGHVSAAGTDFDGSFALGHPEKVTDFGYRAVHEMTVAAKAIVNAYYDRSPSRSYWTGCSTGGRQGLMEAQRYPADYDGIVAGAPANYWTHLMTKGLWNLQAERKNAGSILPKDKIALVHTAVLDACDALDGAKDGVIEDPTRCRFDPAALRCSGNDAADCLTGPQVEGARTMYGPARNPATGAEIFPGVERGSEEGWAAFSNGGPLAEHFANVVFNDAKWDFMTFDFDRDVTRTDNQDHGTINAIDPNLQAFFRRGGKLLMYHGWSDPGIPPANSVNYYRSVALALGGAEKISDSLRLFMGPGMMHCGMPGGVGANIFDIVGTLEQWVEKQQAPDRIVASHLTRGVVDRTHPWCPYPQVAVYGGGDVAAAASFVCKAP